MASGQGSFWGLQLEGWGRSAEEKEDVEVPGESIIGDRVCCV